MQNKQTSKQTYKQTNKGHPPGVETVPRVGKRTGMQTHNVIMEGVLSSSKGIKLMEQMYTAAEQMSLTLKTRVSRQEAKASFFHVFLCG